MKNQISPADFSSKVSAIASSLRGSFHSNESDKTAGEIIGPFPFSVYVSTAYSDNRLHFSALLRKQLPDGKTLYATDCINRKEEIKDTCSADFSRPADAIAKQVNRMIQSVMHWDKIMQAYNDRVETMQKTERTLADIKARLTGLIVDCGDECGFYVRGTSGRISAYADKVTISGLHSMSMSPEKAEKLIRLLVEIGDE